MRARRTRSQGRRLTAGMHAYVAHPAISLRALLPRRATWVAAAASLGGIGPCLGGCADAPWFTEEAQERGIDFVHASGHRERFLLPEIVGSGAALADVDGDGDLDAYLVQSGSLYADGPRRQDRLYFNQGDGRFAAADAQPPHLPGYGMGVAAGDYDNDGDVDLYVTALGPNALLRNDGQGRFENVAADAGVADEGFGASAAFLDLDQDEDLDLFVVNYIHWSEAAEIECYIAGTLTYCPPQNYSAPAPDRLLRNNGDGTFADISEEAGLHLAFGNGFGIVGADFNGDDRTDVYVANDMTVNQLWLNQGDLDLHNAAMRLGVGVDAYGIAKAGMGVVSADLDNDADMDVLVVNLEGQTDSLFRNEGEWFDDVTAEYGLGVTLRHTRFGVALADLDNDGRLDLYEANGRVSAKESRQGDVFAEVNDLYRLGADMRFALVAPPGGTVQPLVHTSRGLAVGDVDADGGLDLLIVNRDAAPYLLMNRVARRGNFVRLRAVTRHGRDAHAATVSATVGDVRLHRDVAPASSYLSSNSPLVHFGLGARTVAENVTVRWPDGRVEAFGDFPHGRTATLRQGEGAAP